MKTKFKKLVSGLLVLAMLAGFVPVVSFAARDGETTDTTLPTVTITEQLVTNSGGNDIYKLVFSATVQNPISLLDTWMTYDNTVVQPVHNANYGDVAIADGATAVTPLKYSYLQDADELAYQFTRGWYVSGKNTTFYMNLYTTNPAAGSFSGTYMEFYYRVANGATRDDFNKNTFKVLNKDADDDAILIATKDGESTNRHFYNPTGAKTSDFTPTLTYHNSTADAGYRPGTAAHYSALDFTKLANTPVKNGEEYYPNTGIYWEKLGGEYTLTLYNVDIAVTGGVVAITIPTGITVQFMGDNNIIGGAGHTGRGIRAGSSSTSSELDGDTIKFIGIDGADGSQASVRFETTGSGIDVYTDLNGTTMTMENLTISSQRLAISYTNNYLDLSTWPFIARTGHLYINNCNITSDSLLGSNIIDANCVATITDSDLYVDNSANSGKSECNAVYADDGLTLNNTNVTVISNNENPTTGVRTNGKLVVNGGTYVFTNIYGFGFDGYTGISFSGNVTATNITYGGVFTTEPTLTGAATLNMTQKGLFAPEQTINAGTYTGTESGWNGLSTYYEAPVDTGTEIYNGNIPQNGDTGFRIRMNNGYTGSELDQMNADAAKYGLHWNPVTNVLTFNNANINNTTEKFAVNTGWNDTTFRFVGDNTITTNVDMANNAYGFMANAESEGNEEYTITSADPANPATLAVNVVNSGAGSAIAFQGGENVRMTDITLDITTDDYGIYRKNSSYAASDLLIERCNVTINAPKAAISINTTADDEYYWPALTVKSSQINIVSGDIELVHQYYSDIIYFSANAASTFTIADGVRLPYDGNGLAAGSYRYVNGAWQDSSIELEKVAKVGSTEYYSVADAVAAITNSGTVTMIADSYEDVVRIPSGKTITLDLGDYWLRGMGASAIWNWGKLTIKTSGSGGISTDTQWEGAVWNAADGIIEEISGGNFEGSAGLSSNGLIKLISGGTFTGYDADGIWLQESARIESITGGTFIGHSDSGIWMGDDSTIGSISGGVFDGYARGIGNDGVGKIDTISGGTFTAIEQYALYVSGSVGEISGGRFECEGWGAVYLGEYMTIDKISGGEFIGGEDGIYIDQEASIGSISGGTFEGVYNAINGGGSNDPTEVTGGKFKASSKEDCLAVAHTIPEGYSLSDTVDGEGYYSVARDYAITATPSKTDAVIGETITVDLIFNGKTNVTGVQATLNYDSTKLQYKSHTSTYSSDDLTITQSDGKVKAAGVGGGINVSNNGIIATVTFEVINVGEAGISVSGVSVSLSGGGLADIPAAPGAPSTVRITRALIASDFEVDTTAVLYSGSAITKEITSNLIENQDYTVQYSADTVNAGTVTITITAAGFYTGSVTFTFNITRVKLADTVITGVTQGEKLAYTGNAVTPAITIKNGDVPLVQGTDYTVAYENNTAVSNEAKVTITGIGNYEGAIVITFEITSECIFGDISFVDNYAAAFGNYKVLKLMADSLPESGKTYLYNGQPMFYAPKYNTGEGAEEKNAYICFAANATKLEDAILILTKDTGVSVEIKYDGDVNGNTLVNINDAQIVYDLFNNIYPNNTLITERTRYEADLNGDGQVTIADVMVIVNKILND